MFLLEVMAVLFGLYLTIRGLYEEVISTFIIGMIILLVIVLSIL